MASIQGTAGSTVEVKLILQGKTVASLKASQVILNSINQ